MHPIESVLADVELPRVVADLAQEPMCIDRTPQRPSVATRTGSGVTAKPASQGTQDAASKLAHRPSAQQVEEVEAALADRRAEPSEVVVTDGNSLGPYATVQGDEPIPGNSLRLAREPTWPRSGGTTQLHRRRDRTPDYIALWAGKGPDL